MTRKVITVLGIILLFVLLGLTGFSLYQNHWLKEYFKLNSDAPAALEYLNHDRMEDMDMDRIRRTAFNYTRPAVKFLSDYDIEAPCDIRYYADVSLKKETKVISKGTVIRVKLADDSEDDLGRGVFSLPSFDKGVRYTRPFTVPSEEQDDAWYYIRLSDLETIMKEVVKTADLKIFEGMSKTIVIRTRCFYIDRLFYRKGIFLSRDIRYKDVKDIIPYIGLPEG